MRLNMKPPRHPERSEEPALFRQARNPWHYLHVLLVAAIVVFGAHASDTTNGPRYQKLSHAIMCPCGCNQLLGECNHVGCPDSDKMRSQLAASIDHGDDDTAIFRAFQDQYGPTALAAPMFTRFNQFSWWVPPIVLLLGIGGVFFVVRRWRPRAVAMPAPASDPHTLVLEQRIRRETGGDSL
jgi:cytochrome c-type biogenesis protein CcmH